MGEQARRDAYLGNSVVFYTSAGRVCKFSGVEASVSKRFAVPLGMQICGIDFEGTAVAGVRLCSAQTHCPSSHETQRYPLS